MPATKKVPTKKVVPAKKAAPAKAVKKTAKPEAADEAPKPRGRQRDVERDAELTAIVLKNVTIEGEFPNHRTKGISAAAEAAGIDAIRARSLVDRHLAEKEGIKTPSVDAVSKARLQQGLGWGVIDAMFGISRSESHRLFDEKHGEGAHSRMKLFGQGGAERIRPMPEAKPKSERKSSGKKAAEYTAMFGGEESKDEIVARLDGKKVRHGVHDSNGNDLGTKLVKVGKGTVKVGQVKGKRVVKFTDDTGNARTIEVANFLK